MFVPASYNLLRKYAAAQLRSKANGIVEIEKCLVVLVAAIVGCAAMPVAAGIFWIEPESHDRIRPWLFYSPPSQDKLRREVCMHGKTLDRSRIASLQSAIAFSYSLRIRYPASRVVGVIGFGIQADGLGVVCNGFVVSAFHFVGDATIVVRFGIRRLQPDPLTQVSDGFVLFALVRVGDAPVEIGVGVLWVKPVLLLAEVGNGFVVLALVPVGDAPAAIRGAVFRVEPDGLVIVADGLVIITLEIAKCVAALEIRICIGGIDANRFGKIRNRFVGVALPKFIGQAAVMNAVAALIGSRRIDSLRSAIALSRSAII